MQFLLRPCFGTWESLGEFWRTILFELLFLLVVLCLLRQVSIWFELTAFLVSRRVSCILGRWRLLVWLGVHSCGVSLGVASWSSLPGFVFPVSSSIKIDLVPHGTLAIGNACPWPWVLLGGFYLWVARVLLHCWFASGCEVAGVQVWLAFAALRRLFLRWWIGRLILPPLC
jgi:hypothetical protein